MSGMHHRRTGYPFGSLVDFANDSTGRELATWLTFGEYLYALCWIFLLIVWYDVCADPIFSLSPLAIHTRNLLADPRCTLVVQVLSALCLYTGP
jgi:putative heme iron utilization protein